MNGTLPFSEIKAYAEAFEITDLPLFLRYINAMERMYLEHIESTREKK